MPTPNPPLSITNDEKGSIIAFFYRIRFDKQFQEAFKKTGRDYNDGTETYKPQADLPKPNPVVRLFELTATQERLIDELHDLELKPEATRDAKWAELMQGASDDVYKWTYQEKTIW